MLIEHPIDKKIRREGWDGTPLGELARKIDYEELEKLQAEKRRKEEEEERDDPFEDIGYTRKR